MPAASAAPASFSPQEYLHFMLHFYASTHDLSGEKKERALAAAACAATSDGSCRRTVRALSAHPPAAAARRRLLRRHGRRTDHRALPRRPSAAGATAHTHARGHSPHVGRPAAHAPRRCAGVDGHRRRGEEVCVVRPDVKPRPEPVPRAVGVPDLAKPQPGASRESAPWHSSVPSRALVERQGGEMAVVHRVLHRDAASALSRTTSSAKPLTRAPVTAQWRSVVSGRTSNEFVEAYGW